MNIKIVIIAFFVLMPIRIVSQSFDPEFGLRKVERHWGFLVSVFLS